MDESIAAVRLRFPLLTDAIDDLASREETFREICGDLAEAQRELSNWQSSTDPDRDGRCAEYQELITELVKEITEMLDRASVPTHQTFAPPVRP
jgi:hypothetical protein